MASKWYIVNTVSGREHKVSEAIKLQVAKKGLEEKFLDVVVPVESVKQVRRGKKVVVDKKMFPGYVVVNMELTDATWNLVKNVSGVSGFLGSGNKPLPITDSEVKRLLQQVEEGGVAKEIEIVYGVGETVKIIDGPFDSFTGNVDDVDQEKQKMKVSVSIFGRSTPVELAFNQVEKID